MADGHPNLNGMWEVMNTAEWDIEPHNAKASPIVVLGAEDGVPPGMGVVEGGPLPYRPEALKQKEENEANSLALDPEVKCFLPGIPRATYMPFPFQIVQSDKYVSFNYEFELASRVVNIGGTGRAPVDSWMGWANGKWEGDTLVADVTDMVADTWFDRAGDYHSENLEVIERYTPVDANMIQYSATIHDPTVYTRDWTMSMPLYRRRDANLQLLDYNCVPFVEELMYGNLRREEPAGQNATNNPSAPTKEDRSHNSGELDVPE